MNNKISSLFYALSIITILYFSLIYYPKWDKKKTETTISWDISGYYFYLPAIFIYKDLKSLKFKDDILSKYRPTPIFQQAFKHKDNYVLKYSCGQAILYAPFFFIGHAIALGTDYPADGFSLPYQYAINFGSLIYAFIGLWFLRKILLNYFSDLIAALTIFSIVVGSNYLEYSAITSAMPHNYLFTIYCILIYCTISFYKNPTLLKSIFIGICVGMAALTRPTEIISCLIPIFWGLNFPLKTFLTTRIKFFKTHLSKILSAIFITALIGSTQLFYWHYVSGDWIIYSYQDQGFSWWEPHFYNCLFSFRNGWLIYSPIMMFSLIGFIFLYKKSESIFWLPFIFCLLFMYITFAWDIWWYGGSLGQRALIQCYPMFAFPLAAFWTSVTKRKVLLTPIAIVSLLFCYHNLWLTTQAHNGGIVSPGFMTKAYFLKVLWKNSRTEEDMKLFDTDEYFDGNRKDVNTIFFTDFEQDTLATNCGLSPIRGQKSLCLNKQRPFSENYFIDLKNGDAEWVRASAFFYNPRKEWDKWKQTLFIIKFFNKDEVIKERNIRVQRILDHEETQHIHFDSKAPKDKFTRVDILFWSPGGGVEILIDDLLVETFNEK